MTALALALAVLRGQALALLRSPLLHAAATATCTHTHTQTCSSSSSSSNSSSLQLQGCLGGVSTNAVFTCMRAALDCRRLHAHNDALQSAATACVSHPVLQRLTLAALLYLRQYQC
jgi:hypothetical protein